MYGLLTKLLLRGNVKFKPGQIIAFNDNFMLLNCRALKYITDTAETLDIKGITDLYLAGWYYGVYTTRELIKSYNLKKFEERYKIAMDIIGVLGVGDYKTQIFERAKIAKFKVLDNPFAKLYFPTKTKKYVCHFIRGMEAGGGTLVHEILMNNLEFECTANNGKYCIHSNLNNDLFLKSDKKTRETQLDLSYALKKEKEILKEAGFNPKKFKA